MIVVTAATGQLGRLVVDALLERGVPAAGIVAAVRSPEKARDLAARGVTVREADYERPETLAEAFSGAERILFISSSGPDDRRLDQHLAVVAAARQAAPALLAYTSVVRADTNPLGLARVHKETEEAIAASGVPSAILRNGWYFENYTATLGDAVARGALVGSAGQGRIAAAARADYAEAAAAVLTGDGHEGKVYELTGDSAFTLADLAAEAAVQSGSQVVYQDLPADAYAGILTGAGLPRFLVELLVDADVKVSQGALETVTGDLSALIGRPATTLPAAVTAALKG
ncbi:SDR family oxidoreductase [Streptomyces capparidis]